jgi:hypothetical protein
MSTTSDHLHDRADAFIARWQGQEGGQERANYALFLTELCDALGLPHPDPADASHERNDYVFERAVTRHRDDGDAIGRIDLYRKNSFVLEAKQSRWKGGKKEIAGQNDLFAPDDQPDRGRAGARRAWDVLMLNAKRQAEEYARALPAAHGWPPFILVCDVGHCIEVYADFTGQGKNYTQFPGRQNFRLYLEDLRKPQVRERRKARQQEHPSLTLTQMYNVLERLKAIEATANTIPAAQPDDRHPEVRAQRASKGDGPGCASFEARLRRTPQDGERRISGAATWRPSFELRRAA